MEKVGPGKNEESKNIEISREVGVLLHTKRFDIFGKLIYVLDLVLDVLIPRLLRAWLAS